MDKPRLLDLFCGAGGAGRGYQMAGFAVTGVDTEPQPHYPGEFVQADALEYLAEHGTEYAAISASPPCQAYSAMQVMTGLEYPLLIEPVRAALAATGKPSVIENVERAPLTGNVVMLCGTMFGLAVRRHRLFELSPDSLAALTPGCACRNGVRDGRLIGHRTAGRVGTGRTKPPYATEAQRRDAMGVDWMPVRAARQAIPPAYTRFIGGALLDLLNGGDRR